MPLDRMESWESEYCLLSCSTAEYGYIYGNDEYSTDFLVDDALEIIRAKENELRDAEDQVQLDDLLRGMLLHMPSAAGARYVAVALRLTDQEGTDAVVNIAKAWLKHLFFRSPFLNSLFHQPILYFDHLLNPDLSVQAMSCRIDISDSQTPSTDNTAHEIGSLTLTENVAAREDHRCAITGCVDRLYAQKLRKQGDPIPAGAQRLMEAAHIIPFPLDLPAESSKLVFRDSVHTLDMFRDWTTLDIRALAGEKINSPANVIYMTYDECLRFCRFEFYLEPDTDEPDGYQVKFHNDYDTLSTGARTALVNFKALEDPKIEVPDPRFLAAHAAFSKVLHLCGVAEYWERLEMQADGDIVSGMNDESNFANRLSAKLALLAY
ncbi:hypothetical protein D9756_010125 [Leucocoprinus leucothites]|uniref:HNH nuclease domain-containing protein n=1 Tax=Leucocoprinus leucothites TaxID=201217 RepID=A0A8H5FSZ3_9AGAR|nr:hypothetical protein D9756_010125 [Leucoagaricus leucothites]